MARKKRKSKEAAPGWAWMLVGLSMGLAVALVVYLESGAPPPAASNTVAVTRPVEAGSTGTGAGNGPATASEPPPVSAPEPEPPAATEAEYEFYRLLREIEVRVPDAERSQDRADAPPVDYTIQAGAFRTFEEADRLQARLGLLGIESHVERAIVRNEIWQRLIIGPLSDRDEISSILRKLREQRIEVMPPQPVDN